MCSVSEMLRRNGIYLSKYTLKVIYYGICHVWVFRKLKVEETTQENGENKEATEIAKSDELEAKTKEHLLKESRKFNIDLAPKVSKIHYTEF